MSTTRKFTGGVSIVGIIIFLFVTNQQKHQSEKWRNEQMKEQYDLKNLIKESNEKSAVFTDIIDNRDSFFNTKNLLNSNGINMNIYYPSHWKETKEDNVELGTIKQYIKEIGDTLTVGMTVNISMLQQILTPEAIDYARSKETLMKHVKGKGDFLSSNNIMVENIKGDEVILRTLIEDGMAHNVIYHFYYKNAVITILYIILNKNIQNASATLKQYKPVFERLIHRTQFFDKKVK